MALRCTKKPSRRLVAWSASLLAFAICAVAAVVLWNVTHGEDPRAYPGSHSQSLDRMLDYYHLQLPACAESTVRYAQFRQFRANSFYLYFSGDETCIQEFLRELGLADEETYLQRGLRYRPGPEEEYGWPEDPSREYVGLSGALTSSSNSNLVVVKISIDYSTVPHSLYLWAATS
jgi:hypothetical protein